jgi:cytochrome c oxidase subunit IV/LysM repeat protein
MAHLSSVSGKNMAHLSSVQPKKMAHKEGQQHPIKLYLVIWGWLFVLSTCSYLVDYFGIEGFLRWFLILLFMIVKAGLIVAVFMHMAWERLALMYAILAPPGAVLLFVAIMAFESDYTHFTRVTFFGTAETSAQTAILEPQTSGSGTATATAPPDQLKKEGKKDGLDVAKPEAASEGRNIALPGSAAATGEAGKAAPVSGNSSGIATVHNDIAAAAKAPESKFYTLKPGDTLWKIAEAEYGPGHGAKYHLIFEANKALLSNPGKLSPGQVLRIPQLSG